VPRLCLDGGNPFIRHADCRIVAEGIDEDLFFFSSLSQMRQIEASCAEYPDRVESGRETRRREARCSSWHLPGVVLFGAAESPVEAVGMDRPQCHPSSCPGCRDIGKPKQIEEAAEGAPLVPTFPQL